MLNQATNSYELGGYMSDRYLRYDINDNVGIGTNLPTDKLTVKTATNSYGIIHTDGSVQVGTAVGIAGSGELGGGVGTKSNHTLRLFTNNNPNGGMTLDVNSNLRQPSSANGLVKAMARVDLDGTIRSCYNSNEIGNSATIAPCGISMNHFTAGGYGMDFHFPIGNRFVSITPAKRDSFNNLRTNTGAYYEGLDGGNTSSVNVRTYITGDEETTTDISFVIIVY